MKTEFLLATQSSFCEMEAVVVKGVADPVDADCKRLESDVILAPECGVDVLIRPIFATKNTNKVPCQRIDHMFTLHVFDYDCKETIVFQHEGDKAVYSL